jgi:hypothetical protein
MKNAFAEISRAYLLENPSGTLPMPLDKFQELLLKYISVEHPDVEIRHVQTGYGQSEPIFGVPSTENLLEKIGVSPPTKPDWLGPEKTIECHAHTTAPAAHRTYLEHHRTKKLTSRPIVDLSEFTEMFEKELRKDHPNLKTGYVRNADGFYEYAFFDVGIRGVAPFEHLPPVKEK